MIRTWSIVAAGVAVLSIAACDRSPKKPGYASHEVLARSALRLGEFEYRLEVRLESSGP
jgi:hypothetical protein